MQSRVRATVATVLEPHFRVPITDDARRMQPPRSVTRGLRSWCEDSPEIGVPAVPVLLDADRPRRRDSGEVCDADTSGFGWRA